MKKRLHENASTGVEVHCDHFAFDPSAQPYLDATNQKHILPASQVTLVNQTLADSRKNLMYRFACPETGVIDIKPLDRRKFFMMQIAGCAVDYIHLKFDRSILDIRRQPFSTDEIADYASHLLHDEAIQSAMDQLVAEA